MFRLKARRGWMPAALGAVVFAGSPYLLLDINVRAAYPEFAAIMCAVGALWALARLFESPGPGRAALLACLLAGALVCHLPATLIFSPVLVGRAIVAGSESTARRRALVWCAAAVLLGAGLSAFYVMPALGERHLIQMGALTRGYFDYQNHFVEPAQWLRLRVGLRRVGGRTGRRHVVPGRGGAVGRHRRRGRLQRGCGPAPAAHAR